MSDVTPTGMTKEEWAELNALEDGDPDGKRFMELLNKTENIEEHPEEYDGPCYCKLCQSYA